MPITTKIVRLMHDYGKVSFLLYIYSYFMSE
jgi:hypothetical protein